MDRPASTPAPIRMIAASHRVSRTPGMARSKPNTPTVGTSGSGSPVAARANPLNTVARKGPSSNATRTHNRTSVISVAKIRPRSSSSVWACSRVKPSTYTDPANSPRPNTPSAASQNVDMDTPANMDTPAATTSSGNARSLLIRFCSRESRITPVATPSPSAVMNSGKVSVLPMTNRAKVGPNGTSMAPPIRPVASPRITPRTIGFT